MAEKRIILANGSRLMREMLNRILIKAGGMEIVRVIKDDEWAADIELHDADWVILTLPVSGNLPQWVTQTMDEHPSVNFMTISANFSQVRTKLIQEQDGEELDDITLEDLIRILRQVPNMQNSSKG